MRIIQSANPRPLNLLAVGPNGLVAANDTSDAGGHVEVWDAGSGRLIDPAVDDHQTEGLAFLHDGRYLFVARGPDSVALNPLTGKDTGRVSLEESNWWYRLAVAADGSHLLASDSRFSVGFVGYYAIEGECRFRHLWTSEREAHLWIQALAVAPDGATVALAEQVEPRGRPSLHLSIRTGSTGKQRNTVPIDPASPVRQLAFSADGAKLLARTDSNAVQLFDAATGADLGALKHKGRPFVTGIAVHPRGPVACARTDGTVTMWDAETREQRRVLDWKAGRLVSVAFAPDGALAAAGTEDGKVIVWDVDE
ncbi:MAG: WD40 repeat domain-containing protein [Planctomycetes bacterium]|nr:WD40 repeat domain-containing protein [Planctomycetota bacterium]